MTILHFEDSASDAILIKYALREEWPNCEIRVCAKENECRAALQSSQFDIILSDFSFPCFDGLEALRMAKEHAPATPFIFVSGTIGEDRAIEALRMGAADYVPKDRLKQLITTIRHALAEPLG